MRMRGTGRIAAAGIFILMMVQAGAAFGATHRLKPSGAADVVKVKTGTKTSVYHAASSQKPLDYALQGPISMRLLLRNLNPGGLNQRVRIEVDGTVLRSATVHAAVAKHAALDTGLRVGALSRTVIQIPAGRHRVRIVPQSDNARVAVRVLAGTAARSAIKWVPYSPETYERSVRIQEKDIESTCYRFSAEKPIGMTLRGPLRIRATSRIDFGMTNGYTQSYILRVILDGNPWKSYSLKSRASHTATYPELPEITPGLGRSFDFAVPSGSHEIRLVLDGTTAGGGSVQIRIPEKDLRASNRS